MLVFLVLWRLWQEVYKFKAKVRDLSQKWNPTYIDFISLKIVIKIEYIYIFKCYLFPSSEFTVPCLLLY